jgi:hypothetical protein
MVVGFALSSHQTAAILGWRSASFDQYEPSCATTRRTLPPWTYSLFQLSVSTCSMPFVIVRLDRRDLVWINVTASPTAE